MGYMFFILFFSLQAEACYKKILITKKVTANRSLEAKRPSALKVLVAKTPASAGVVKAKICLD